MVNGAEANYPISYSHTIEECRAKSHRIISILKQSIAGDWDRLDNFIKIGGFVNCNPNYSNQPIIINGASDLLVKIFGDKGKHTRVAVGSIALPLDISVEIDAIIKIK